MAEMSDFLQAINQFQGAVQQAAANNAVDEATQAVNQINLQVQDEGQKRQALQNLGNQLALKLVGTGASSAHIQQAFNAVAPQQFGSVEQMQIEGALQGNPQLNKASEQLLQQREARQQKMINWQMQKELQVEQAKGEMQMRRELIKQGMAPRQLKPEDVAFQTNVKMGSNFADQLSQAIERSGTWESRFGNTEDAAALQGLPYKLAITYAKIVDPNSVAREGEVAAAQKYLIELGPTASKEVVMNQLAQMKDTIKSYEQARGEAGSPAAQQQAAPSWSVHMTPNGPVQVRILPNGQVEVK